MDTIASRTCTYLLSSTFVGLVVGGLYFIGWGFFGCCCVVAVVLELALAHRRQVRP